MSEVIFVLGISAWLLWCFILTPKPPANDVYYLSPFDEGWGDNLNPRASYDVEEAIAAAYRYDYDELPATDEVLAAMGQRR